MRFSSFIHTGCKPLMKFVFSLILVLLNVPLTLPQSIANSDSLWHIPRDTTFAPLYAADTSRVSSATDSELNPELEKSLQKYWQQEFLKMISKSNSGDSNIVTDTGLIYEQYSGKIIRNIRVKQCEVFGQTIADTACVPTKWYEKVGNDLHVKTRKKILRKKIDLEKGDTLNPFVLADNERLIRELPYIQSVRIIVTEVGNDSLDLMFVTKDVYSLGFGFEVYDVSYGKTGVWNKNLFGIGHEFYYYLTWNFNRRHNYGHTVRYRIQNIGNTFITADVSYEDLWAYQAFKISLNRDFLTPEMKYAGGIGYENIKNRINIELQDTILIDKDVDYDLIDVWLGRSFLLSESYTKRKRTNLALAGRVMSYKYFARPEEVSPDYLHEYHSRTMLLGSIGISTQAFKKSYLVYGFGIAEDIPYGVLLTFTAGLEKSEFNNRPYIGFSYSFGTYGLNFGMLNFKIEYGTFFNNGMEQGALNLTFSNYSPLYNRYGRYNYRLFTKINYKTGINRFSDEFIRLDEDNNIRGLKNPNLTGDQLFNINFESVCYSPHYLAGFRFVYFLFFDAGLINNKNEILPDSPVYSGFGAGIRIKNENLVFNTIQLRFAYYPVVPANSDLEYVHLSGMTTPRPESFIIPKPYIVE